MWGSALNDPALANGIFIKPTGFADVSTDMTIAREELFGPVLGVLRWSDGASMPEQLNRPEYGLTCTIWTNDLTAP